MVAKETTLQTGNPKYQRYFYLPRSSQMTQIFSYIAFPSERAHGGRKRSMEYRAVRNKQSNLSSQRVCSESSTEHKRPL